MSDSKQCTPLDPEKPTFNEVQDELQIVANGLHNLFKEMEDVCSRLPKMGRDFEPLAELRAAMDCVRSDLLGDAIETLKRAGTLTEEQLKQRFEERQEWLVVVM